jgi:hypothetical protein
VSRILAWGWRNRSIDLQILLALAAVVLACVLISAVTYPLPAHWRNVIAALLLCAGGLIGLKPVLDRILPHAASVIVSVLMLAAAPFFYLHLGFIHVDVLRIACAAVCATALALPYEGMKRTGRTFPEVKVTNAWALTAGLLLVLGTVVAVDPVSLVASGRAQRDELGLSSPRSPSRLR